jgi:hypothetical protein
LSGPAASLGNTLEPHHSAAQHAALPQRLACSGRGGAEVFPDNDGIRPLGLSRKHAEEVVSRILDVDAIRRWRTLRNPPHPEQAEDVVDTDSGRVAQVARITSRNDGAYAFDDSRFGSNGGWFQS